MFLPPAYLVHNFEVVINDLLTVLQLIHVINVAYFFYSLLENNNNVKFRVVLKDLSNLVVTGILRIYVNYLLWLCSICEILSSTLGFGTDLIKFHLAPVS